MKKINFLGDSITEGAGASTCENRYTTLTAKYLNVEECNYGVGGTRIAKQKTYKYPNIDDNEFMRRAVVMADDADFTFVFGGTNDYGHGDAQLGCMEDRDTYTFYGAMHELVAYLLDKFGKERDIETDALILSVGHSARDTIEMLYKKGINMMQKPFSVGARIEHPQEYINSVQYGEFKNHPKLKAADYKLACHPPHGRGAYTFCMCPGGTVVCASSQKGGVVTNGMSEFARDKENANSAILVGVEPADFPTEHPLSGFELQRSIEEKAFSLGGGDYSAPATLVGDFLRCQKSTKLGFVKPSFTTGVTMGDISEALPQKVVNTMRDALVQMDKKLKGFAMDEAVLTAPETRSSSPVRIIRDEFFQTNVRGLYPCGEGAGYAGGIVSAGVDGVKCAEAVLSDLT